MQDQDRSARTKALRPLRRIGETCCEQARVTAGGVNGQQRDEASPRARQDRDVGHHTAVTVFHQAEHDFNAGESWLDLDCPAHLGGHDAATFPEILETGWPGTLGE